MSAISELIRSEADGTISFGDYTLDAKAKLDNFGHQGDLYKVKTYKDITKLERTGNSGISFECNGHRNFFFRGRTGRCSDHTRVRRRD